MIRRWSAFTWLVLQDRAAHSRLLLFAPEAHEDNCGEGPQSGVLHSLVVRRPGRPRSTCTAARPLWSVREIGRSPFQDGVAPPQEGVRGVDRTALGPLPTAVPPPHPCDVARPGFPSVGPPRLHQDPSEEVVAVRLQGSLV